MLILFDVDGTLAESGKKMTCDMSETLINIKNKTKCLLGIVGGGNINKILYQLDQYKNIFDYIFSECGAVVYEKFMGNFRCIHKKSMMEQLDKEQERELNIITELFLKILKDNNIETRGKNVDVRSGLIYLSMPGMDADDNLREKFFRFSKNNGFIENTLGTIKERTKKFIIAKGGEAGYSVTLPSWDKSQVMNMIPNIIKDEKNIYFFGDKCEIDGNDYPLYSHELIKGYSVKNYQDTIEQLKCIFNT